MANMRNVNKISGLSSRKSNFFAVDGGGYVRFAPKDTGKNSYDDMPDHLMICPRCCDDQELSELIVEHLE